MSENSIINALIIQEAEDSGIPEDDIDKYLEMTFEEKEACLRRIQYLKETGKPRL